MLDRLKAITAALPAFAVLAVAAVFGYAWALFRSFDSSWIGTLSPGDIFALGWSLTPGLIAGGLVGASQSQAAASGASPPRAIRHAWPTLRLFTAAIIILTAIASFYFPLGRYLDGVAGRTYLSFAAFNALVFGIASTKGLAGDIKDRAGYHRRTWMLFGVSAFLLVDAFGGVMRNASPGHKVILDSGQSACVTIVHAGQSALYVHHPASKESAMVERRILRAIVVDPDCSERGQATSFEALLDEKPKSTAVSPPSTPSTQPAPPSPPPA